MSGADTQDTKYLLLNMVFSTLPESLRHGVHPLRILQSKCKEH